MSYDDGVVRVGDTAVGRGVFACTAIEAYQMAGEVLGTAGTELESDDCYHIDLTQELVLDPHPPYRYLNHSCEPNCELMVVESDIQGQLPRVYVAAIRDINAEEQLTIDYGWPASAAIECKCGSKDCRGWVVAESELPLVRQATNEVNA